MRTRILEKKENLSEKIIIPENILQETNEKWFFVYNWIDEKEIKTSIELDFLKKMSYLWPIWLFLAVLWYIFLNIFWVLIAIALFSILMVIYITFSSISKTLKASKISHLVITNKYFLVNKKVWKISENSIILDKESQKIWEIFQENLFLNSDLKNQKNSAQKNITSLVKKWFDFIGNLNSSWRDSAQLKMILIVIFIVFLITMWILYFAWILITAIFWIFINFLVKKYLIWKWHLVLAINEDFKEIEKFSEKLKNEKNLLENNLKEASKNNWQDWLLLKINSWIENVNKNAKNAMEKNLELVEKMKNSEYNDIFDYILYNSWLKKQIATPIKWIIEMLQENIFLIEKEIENTEKTLEKTDDEKLKWHLEVSKNKLLMKKDEIEKHLLAMKWYLLKLEL